MAKKEVCKKGKYWTLSTGEGPVGGSPAGELTDGGNNAPPYMFIQMDELAKQGKPIVLETDDEKVLDNAATYAAQKGYDLVSPNPEQNLKISDKLNELAGEEIAEGHFLPSQQKQQEVAPNYRPFTVAAPDRLPDGFESEVRVHPVVIREGARMAPESPEKDDAIQHWEAVRIFHQKDLNAPHIFGDYRPRMTVERQSFATPEEAIVAAQGMANAPATPEMLRKSMSADLGPEHPHNRLLSGLIEQQDLSRQKSLADGSPEPKAPDISPRNGPVQEESAADIAADIGRIASQSPQPFPAMQPAPSRSLQQTPQIFPEKRPAEVLEKRLFVAAVKDHGNRITVTRMGMAYVNPKQKRERDDRVARSLQMARERFGDPVRVEGNSGFEQSVIKAAIAQGIPLEMASERGAKAYQLALQSEKKRGLEKTMGSLAPSKQKQIDRGNGRGLAIGM